MSTTDPQRSSRDVWLVYDGECPVCTTYCRYVRLKEAAGVLHLVDARQPSALLDEVTAMGLDIDQGMVVKLDGNVYYGADAIRVLTLLTTPSGAFNRLNRLVFSTRMGARLAYPVGKAARNVLLRALGIRWIDNLGQARSAAAADPVHPGPATPNDGATGRSARP